MYHVRLTLDDLNKLAKERDGRKNRYCEELGIALLRIPEREFLKDKQAYLNNVVLPFLKGAG